MRLAIIGYGRMGRVIETVARQEGHEIVAIVDPAAPEPAYRRLSAEAVEQADVCMEFTRPQAAVENILQLCAMGKPVVVGTTGWYQRVGEVREAAVRNKVAVLYGANFSIGVNLFFRLVEHAAELFGSLADRDVYVVELHHRAKRDAPSGTASRLAEIILSRSKTKDRTAPKDPTAAIGPDELQVAAVRAGWIPGTHRVGIEGKHDSIVLEHQARSREGFAEGAIRAAQWLIQAQPALYRFEDVLGEILGL